MENKVKEDLFIESNLLNKNYSEIIDIIMEDIKKSKQVKRNRAKILSLLNETYPGITADNLEFSFKFIQGELKDFITESYTLKAINENIGKLSIFIHYINKETSEYKDYGYSLLLTGYFWITKNFK